MLAIYSLNQVTEIKKFDKYIVIYFFQVSKVV